MNCLWIIISFTLISNSLQIQNQLRRPVRFIEENDYLPINNNNIKKFDWEPALRASTLQALLREHVDDANNLRFRIYSAPLIGKQETATPFGDVAILARGQLFANYAGFLFIQDPYQNDCDDCHNRNRGECVHHGQCNIWHSFNDNKQLIALWSIKRIRHHTISEKQNQLEIIFSISPVSLSHPLQNYLTREGKFNYNIPGHVFVLKTTEYLSRNNFQYKESHFRNEAYLAATPSDSIRIKFHDIPGPFTSATYLPPRTFSQSLASESTEESAKKLYEQLIEHINKKTSTESHRNTPENAKSSTTTIPASTLVQFADGQILPITEIQSPYVTKSITGFVTVKFPESTSLPQHTTEEIKKLHQVPQPTSTPAAALTQEFLSTTTKIRPQSYGTFSTRLKQTSTSGTTFIPIIPITTQFYSHQQTKPFYTKPISEEPHYVISKIPPNITTTIFYAEESPASSTLENVQNINQDRTPLQPTTNPNKFTIEEFLYPTPTVNTITTDGQHHTITDYYYHHPNSEIPSVPTTKASFSITNPPITVYDDDENLNQTPSAEENASPTKFDEVAKFTHPTTSFYYTSNIPITTNLQHEHEQETDTSLVTQQRIPTSGNYTVKTTAMPATTSELSTDNNFHYSTRYSEENSEETSSFSFTPTTLTQFESATSPPQFIATNIAGSVKTTTLSAERELFGVAKPFTRPFKTTKSLKVSSTEASDFLKEDSVDFNDDNKKPLYKNSAKDYNNEELFGTTKVNVNSNRLLSKKPKTAIKYNKSNVELALFDNFDKTKIRRSTTTPSSALDDGMEKDLFYVTTPVTVRPNSFTTKISTSSIKTSTKFNRKSRKSGPRQNPKEHQINVTATTSSLSSKEFLVPVTSQSVATSISYEVNKKRKSSDSNNEKKRKTEWNESNNYNDFPLRLLNEAKSIEYLAKNSLNKTTNRPKYVQRLNSIPNKVNSINKNNKNSEDKS